MSSPAQKIRGRRQWHERMNSGVLRDEIEGVEDLTVDYLVITLSA